MSYMAVLRTGVRRTPAMESTRVIKDLTGAGAVKVIPEVGTLAIKLSDISSMYNGALWGDVMLGNPIIPISQENRRKCDEVFKMKQFTKEFLTECVRQLIDEQHSWPQDEWEAEMALLNEQFGKEKVDEIINMYDDTNRRIIEQEKARVEEEKACAVKAAEVAAKLAARNVATAKNGRACKYFRNNGTPEPAQNGWEAGCDYHKLGKCPCIHPDEDGWNEAVAKRVAYNSQKHHHAPRGGGESRTTRRW